MPSTWVFAEGPTGVGGAGRADQSQNGTRTPVLRVYLPLHRSICSTLMQTVDCICTIDIFAATPKAVPAALPLTPLVAHPQPVAFQTLYLLEAVGHGGDGAAQEVTRLERRGLRY